MTDLMGARAEAEVRGLPDSTASGSPGTQGDVAMKLFFDWLDETLGVADGRAT
jgi:hypothetical protein